MLSAPLYALGLSLRAGGECSCQGQMKLVVKGLLVLMLGALSFDLTYILLHPKEQLMNRTVAACHYVS
jgi:hypothetical protein